MQENIQFEVYTANFHEFPFTEIKDELEETLDFSSFSLEHLQDKMIGPRTIKAPKNFESERKRTFGYIMIIFGLRLITMSRF